MNRTHLCPAFPRHMCTTTNYASAHMLHRPTVNCFQGRTSSWYCFTVQPSSKGQMTWDDTCSSNNYAHYDLTVTPFAFSGTTFHISCTRSILEKGTWRFMVIPHAYDLWQYLGSDHMEAEFMLCELQDLRQERRRHYNTACTRWAEFVWHDVSEEWRQNFLYDMAPEVDTPAILLKQIFGSSSS